MCLQRLGSLPMYSLKLGWLALSFLDSKDGMGPAPQWKENCFLPRIRIKDGGVVQSKSQYMRAAEERVRQGTARAVVQLTAVADGSAPPSSQELTALPLDASSQGTSFRVCLLCSLLN